MNPCGAIAHTALHLGVSSQHACHKCCLLSPGVIVIGNIIFLFFWCWFCFRPAFPIFIRATSQQPADVMIQARHKVISLQSPPLLNRPVLMPQRIVSDHRTNLQRTRRSRCPWSRSMSMRCLPSSVAASWKCR